MDYMSALTSASSSSSSSSTFSDFVDLDPTKKLWLEEHCPCLPVDAKVPSFMFAPYSSSSSSHSLHRMLEEEDPPTPVWHTVIVAVTLVVMFGFMMTDYIGPDWVMTAGLAFFLACEIVSIPDGLKGFANEGVLTVMALFVVAEGLSRTGALDYYLGLILGTPKTIPGAQIRLMVPIATLSAFLNNTPIVAVMIPLTLRWAKKIGVPKEQLLMPLSFATILGGTCTLVGTSTNLVVSGLLEKEYGDEASGNIGLFDLAIYGVPNAMIGISYMLVAAPFLLPKGRRSPSTNNDELLLGAIVKPWSPAAGRTYKRSGLGDSGGIVLTSVLRAATGNLHRAVSGDFVISVGDELYFTGSVENFGEFCDKYGLEVITTDNVGLKGSTEDYLRAPSRGSNDAQERLQQVRRLSDQIEGRADVEAGPRPVQLLVTFDETEQVVLVGVDTEDRPGILKLISDGITEQKFNIRHSEAKVFEDRSLSVWRLEPVDPAAHAPDLNELWAAVYVLLKDSDRPQVKRTGARVVRAVVPKESSLVGKKPIDVDFRNLYGASIVAYQKNSKNYMLDAELAVGDLLVLYTDAGSPLLSKPPSDFYNAKKKKDTSSDDDSDVDVELDLDGAKRAWTDLRVEFEGKNDGVPKGEFLTALTVPPNSNVVGKSLEDAGYARLAETALISIERPTGEKHTTEVLSVDDPLRQGDILWYSGSAEAVAELQRLHGLAFYHEDKAKTGKASVHLTERRFVQAVIARGSTLVGQTPKESKFRSVYGGTVIAIQRGSDRVHDFPANVTLKTGDVLLVDAGPTFAKKNASDYRTFALVSEVENSAPPRPRLFLMCVVLIIASLAVAAVEIRSLLITATLVGVVMVATGVVTQQEARDCLQWDLYITIACAFGIGAAMTNSGVANGIATFLVNVGLGLGIGVAGVYGAVYFAGNLLSAILTNNAAATLMFPIAMDAVDQTGADRLKMSMILMLSASDYITSFGYQCNLMVYGPGEYANIDFFKFGSIMQILLWLSTTAMVSTLSIDNPKWVVSWIVCGIAFIVIAVVRLTGSLFFFKKKEEEEVGKGSSKLTGGLSWQLASRAHDEIDL